MKRKRKLCKKEEKKISFTEKCTEQVPGTMFAHCVSYLSSRTCTKCIPLCVCVRVRVSVVCVSVRT